MNKKITKNIIVIYHNECTDGFSAAWAAYKKFGNRADYIGVEPGSAPIDGLRNKELYMVDLIYPSEYLGKLVKDNKKVVAIDHHFSNRESFKLVEGLFDLNHSGAILAWQYFNPDKNVPRLLKYVEDMDLWKFNLSGTKEIISYLDLIDFGFKAWDKLATDIENKSKYKEYFQKGELILKYQDKIIEDLIVNYSDLVEFFGYKAYAINSPIFQSQMGNALTKKLPPIGIVWREGKNGKIHVSLRSDGTADVSKLASKFPGGGGHKASAGFTVDNYSKLPWKKIKS